MRYADDFVVLCASQEEAQRAYEAVRSIIEGKLHLRLHPEKTRIVSRKASLKAHSLLLLAMWQRYTKAVYGKSVRTV